MGRDPVKFGCIILALAWSSPAFSQSFVGKGVKGTYVWTVCNSINCTPDNTTSFDIYVGRQGHVFDYLHDQGSNGNLIQLGVPNGNTLVTTHGNVMTWTTTGGAGRSIVNFTIRGSSCSVSTASTYAGTKLVVKSQTCEVTSGRGE